MGMDRKDFEMGIILGLCAPPAPQIPGEPIAYSYNGVVLPKLPEWDRSVYPYACIADNLNGGTVFTLCISDVRIKVGTGDSAGNYNPMNADVTFKCSSPYVEWMTGKGLTGRAVWANQDVYDNEGSLYLEGSAPMPIYE